MQTWSPVVRSAEIPEHKVNDTKKRRKICPTVLGCPKSFYLNMAHVSRLWIFFQGSYSYFWLYCPCHSQQIYEEQTHKRVLRASGLRTQEWRNPVEGTDNEKSGKGKQHVKCWSATSHTWGRIAVDTVETQARLNSGGNRSLQPFKLVLTPISKNDTNPQPSWQINKVGVFGFLLFVFSSPILQALWDF